MGDLIDQLIREAMTCVDHAEQEEDNGGNITNLLCEATAKATISIALMLREGWKESDA